MRREWVVAMGAAWIASACSLDGIAAFGGASRSVRASSAPPSARLVPPEAVQRIVLTLDRPIVFVPHGSTRIGVVAHGHRGLPIGPARIEVAVRTLAGPRPTLDVRGQAMRFFAGRDAGRYLVEARVGTSVAKAEIATHPITPGDVAAAFRAKTGARIAQAGTAGRPTALSELGRRLFFDTRLSRNGTLSCASCHDPEKGWGDAEPRSIGNMGQAEERNAPSILDVGLLAGPFLWDGRAPTLEDQVVEVFKAPAEFGRSAAEAAAALGEAGYDEAFREAFGSPGVDLDRVAKAIASFERTVVTDPSPLDRWSAGDAAALSAAEIRGLGVFTGKGQCVACHNGPHLTDEKHHATAVAELPWTSKHGRAAVTRNEADTGKYKTPSLRNCAVSAPYFHNGIAATLQEAIRHYETVGLPGVPAAGAFTDGSETVFVETATAGTSVGGCTSTKVWKDGKLVSQAPGRCGAIAGGVAEDRPRAAATAMPDSAAKHPGEDVAEEIFDFPDLVDRINLTDTERADLEAFLKKVGGKPPAIAAP